MIQFPSVDTYYISYDNDQAFLHNGMTETNQQTENALDVMETFTVEQDYLDRLDALGIEFEEEIQTLLPNVEGPELHLKSF